MADWSKIKAEYIRDENASYRSLAEKHGVSFNTLKKIARQEKWPELRTQKDHKRTTRIVDACATQEAKKAVKVTDIADILLGKLRESVDEIDPRDYERLMEASSILRTLKETRKGLNDADLREQEARIAKLKREAEGEEKKDTSYQIEFVGMDWDNADAKTE